MEGRSQSRSMTQSSLFCRAPSPDGLSQGQTQPQSRPTSVPGEIRDNERCHPYVGNDLVIDVVVSRQVDVLPAQWRQVGQQRAIIGGTALRLGISRH